MLRLESFYRGDISRIHERLLGICSILLIFFPGCDSNEETRLTCMFGEDMNERRQDFKLLDEKSETALKCNWKQGKLWCLVGDGYTYDWKISDTVTVRRDQRSEPVTCSCFLVDADNTEYERPCISEVGNIEASSRLTSKVPEHIPSTVPEIKDQTQTSQIMQGGVSMVIILLSVSTALISIFAATVVLVLALKRLRRRASDKTSQGKLLRNSHENNNGNKASDV